jgi:hypothetical protein
MTAELWTQLVGGAIFFITVSGALWGIWWRIEGKVSVAEDKAAKVQERSDKVASDLASFRVHAAETFATKQGMQEQTSQLLRAIEGVGNRIDGMNERLDRAFEHTAAAPPRRRNA